MTDEDSAEHLANEIDSSKITPETISLLAGIDIPSPTQELAKALANTPTLSPPALKILAENNALMMGITQEPQQLSRTLTAFTELTIYPEIDAMVSMSSIAHQPIIDALTALNDLPVNVFSTAVTASTISASTSLSPSPSSTEPVIKSGPEQTVDPTHTDVDYDLPQSAYVNTAFAIGSYAAHQIDGLSEEEQNFAAYFIGGCIAFGVGFMFLGLPTALPSAAFGGGGA
ncbi:hypothetical protein [Halorubrum halophilum]|uniref:hypothetical protein n=1 Tax=Halorubrum halophilum TaxID=413816 RepID=UPI0006785F7D|nr:hypothetical protein [Halorubrum halophilum]